VYAAVAYGLAYTLDYTAILPLLGEGRSLAALPLLLARMAAPALGAYAAYLAAGRPGSLSGWTAVRPPSVGALLASAAAALAGYTLSLPISLAAGLTLGPCGPLAGLAGAQLALASALALAGGLAAGVSVNALAALGEEAGWRGYLLDRLSASLGFWPAALAVGVAWGLWHAPLVWSGYDYVIPHLGGCGPGASGPAALAVFTAYTASAGLVAAGLRRAYNTSVAPAAFHGTVNAVAGFYAALVAGSRLLAPPAGLSVAAGMAAVAAAVGVLRRGGEG